MISYWKMFLYQLLLSFIFPVFQALLIVSSLMVWEGKISFLTSDEGIKFLIHTREKRTVYYSMELYRSNSFFFKKKKRQMLWKSFNYGIDI